MTNQANFVITNDSINILADRIISHTPGGSIAIDSPVVIAVITIGSVTLTGDLDVNFNDILNINNLSSMTGTITSLFTNQITGVTVPDDISIANGHLVISAANTTINNDLIITGTSITSPIYRLTDYNTGFFTASYNAVAFVNPEATLITPASTNGSLGSFVPATGVWTCTEDGLYVINVHCSGITVLTGGEDNCFIRIYRNAAIGAQQELYRGIPSVLGGAMSVTLARTFVNTDTSTIRVFQTSGTSTFNNATVAVRYLRVM